VRCCNVAAAGGETIGTRGIVIFTRGEPAAHVYVPSPVIVTSVDVTATVAASTRIEPK